MTFWHASQGADVLSPIFRWSALSAPTTGDYLAPFRSAFETGNRLAEPRRAMDE